MGGNLNSAQKTMRTKDEKILAITQKNLQNVGAQTDALLTTYKSWYKEIEKRTSEIQDTEIKEKMHHYLLALNMNIELIECSFDNSFYR